MNLCSAQHFKYPCSKHELVFTSFPAQSKSQCTIPLHYPGAVLEAGGLLGCRKTFNNLSGSPDSSHLLLVHRKLLPGLLGT